MSLRRIVLAGLFPVVFATGPARAEDWTLLGAWVFAEAQLAPWRSESYKARALEQAKELLQKEITFTPTAVIVQHHTLACTGVAYQSTSFPPDIVFQSGLPGPDHAAQARALGLSDTLAPGIDLGCSTGLYSYHFVDRDTVLLGFNDVIYTLKRR